MSENNPKGELQVETAVYHHNDKGQRDDAHRPSVINPGDYEYQHVGVNRKDKIKGGPAGTCHHCGKAIVWEVVWKHLPSDNLVTFGETCTEILGMSNDRIQHEMVLLKRQVENERQQEKNEQYKQEKKEKFAAEHPDIVKFLDSIDEDEEQFYFIVDMKRSLDNWGSLTDNQAAAVQRTMEARKAYMQRKYEEALNEVEPEDEVEPGRYVIEGTVISHKWQDNSYTGGRDHKMLVKMDDGNKVWGSVPRSVSDYCYHNDENENRDLKGLRVRFTATVSPSDRDSHFGFYKRPSSAEVI